jgi:quinohemoprotein ethanol dehydrogenase
MQAPKDGFFYVLDRRTGKLISAEPFVPTTWASRVDLKTGRPVENPDARYGEKPVLLSPGAGGAHNFNPMAYSPQTGLVYFNVVQDFMTFSAASSFGGGGGLGTGFGGYDQLRKEQADYADTHLRSWLVAWDPVKGRAAWKVPYKRNGSGGTLATAGGLVFQGTSDKTFAAYRASDGRKLWEVPVQSIPIAGPVTYTVGGQQYVALNAGWGGGLAHVQATHYQDLNVAPGRLLVFRLGGKASLPPQKAALVRPAEPPFLRASEAEVKKGAALYAQNCALCHGQLARGGIKDLRQMTPDTHAHFLDIVLGGARAKAGMASFADVLQKDDAEAIHSYLIARAREDWGELRRAR